MKNRFFSKFDWAAFWTATLVTFAVYFYTIGPSVGLEDSGELATASAHLGVPHPPGYPFWTFCTWLFCKAFSFVTYMGHPTPAWAASLFSAVAGAFAAGCTAMLICRSARDFLEGVNPEWKIEEGGSHMWLSFAGGVGGALAFAFSPVEWSQSTIVEIYSLGSLFLMLVLLLSYRWMRRPTDMTLWLTAFVFGLGLTNYQVLLFAIVPLAIIIALRNISMFRDFALFLVPVLLTYQVLQVGDLGRAQYGMDKDVIAKHQPVGITDRQAADGIIVNLQPYQQYFREFFAHPDRWALAKEASRRAFIRAQNSGDKKAFEDAQRYGTILRLVEQQAVLLDPTVRKLLAEKDGPRFELVPGTNWCPDGTMVALSLVLFVGALLAAVRFKSKGRRDLAVWWALGGGAAVVAGFFLATAFFSHSETWVGVTAATAPLAEPAVYLTVAAFAAVSLAAAVASSIAEDDPALSSRGVARTLFWVSAGAAALAVLSVFVLVGQAQDLAISGPVIGGTAGYVGPQFPWDASTFAFWAVIVLLFAIALFVKKGMLFAIPVAGFHIALFYLLRRGAMNGLVSPASWWFWWPIAWNFAVLALSWHVLPHGRSVAGAAFFTQLGVSFYAYMPFVSDIRNPPMNWGYPRTWEGFKHAITRGQYEAIKAASFDTLGGFFDFFRIQMGHYFRDVKLQFTDFLAILAAVPFVCWHFTFRGGAKRIAVRIIWAAAAILGVFVLRDVFSGILGATEVADGSFWSYFDRALVVALGTLAAVGCILIGVLQLLFRPAVALRRYLELARKNGDWRPFVGFGLIAAVAVFLPLGMHIGRGGGGATSLAVILLLAVFAAVVFATRPILAAIRRAHAAGHRLAFDARNVSQQWLIALGACFIVMSVLLILLAKVQGDVQDGFIQKVKFIMSHAMIAMWIGYGFVFASMMLSRFIPRRFRPLAVCVLGVVCMAVGAIPPIVQNYTNDRLVLELGGAEQNGHTFGWQFGAYQLDGAKAIRRQIAADEEPLPDPDWPEPMEDHAFFFGGTDPGRFVPTYMIYSAQFRPDVYLITQNALADGTYMSVERDLYGDEIWIPANEDNASAFNEFVSRLSEEERQRYGVVMDNGRVQVTGAQSVMLINAILAQKMFEKNRDRNAFYVEESYPIEWMYDYLTPHGLIMKIERDKTENGADSATWKRLVRKDRDFWDWYVRKLLDDPMFRRDFAAQKSFAKLRSAIAGLEMQKMLRGGGSGARSADGMDFRSSCEQAFREACLLSPISPESTFRYIQTHLFNRGQLTPDGEASANVVEDLLNYLKREDPHSTRPDPYLEEVRAWRLLARLQRETAELEQELQKTTDAQKRLRLAWETAVRYDALGEACSRAGNGARAGMFARMAAERAAGVWPQRAAIPELNSAQGILAAAEIFDAAGRMDMVAQAVNAFYRVSSARPPELKALVEKLKNNKNQGK